MPTLFGETLSRRAFLERVGTVHQVGGVRRVRLEEGPEDGVSVLEVRTGAGFDVDVIASRGLDLGAARLNGRPLSWLSAAGFPHPGLVSSDPNAGFLRAFGGGLLTTCGLTNVGDPNVVDGVTYPQHGRASASPAYEVSALGEWRGDEYFMTVRGKTRDAVLYGDKLEKTRVIRARLGVPEIELEDTVENVGSAPAAAMILYHVNLGWPLIQAGARLEARSARRTVKQGDGSDWAGVPAPRADFGVTVIEHELEPDADGWARVAVQGPAARFEMDVDASTLPRFTQWRQFGAGDYVLGLEPGNVGVYGRATEVANGTLPVLEPGESRSYRVRLRASLPGA